MTKHKDCDRSREGNCRDHQTRAIALQRRHKPDQYYCREKRRRRVRENLPLRRPLRRNIDREATSESSVPNHRQFEEPSLAGKMRNLPGARTSQRNASWVLRHEIESQSSFDQVRGQTTSLQFAGWVRQPAKREPPSHTIPRL